MTVEAPQPGYPVNLEVERPASQSRLTNLPLGIGLFIRYVLLVPHLLVLAVLGILAIVVYFIATFAILFTGTFPRGMFGFVVGAQRWSHNVQSYLLELHDQYPPFSTEQQAYPLSFSVEYPEHSSRILNFPIVGLYIKEILTIPHFLALFLLLILAYVVMIIAPFAILFTGSFPQGMHRFVVGVSRWGSRVSAYILALTDRYPPFSLT